MRWDGIFDWRENQDENERLGARMVINLTTPNLNLEMTRKKEIGEIEEFQEIGKIEALQSIGNFRMTIMCRVSLRNAIGKEYRFRDFQ
jgi:hypothetical protein